MNADSIAVRANLPVKTAWWASSVEAKSPMSANSMAELAALQRAGFGACMSNLILCLSLWISLIAAIWLTRGWIGLFFSGQVLSAGACLFQTLLKRTHYAFSPGNVQAHELENGPTI